MALTQIQRDKSIKEKPSALAKFAQVMDIGLGIANVAGGISKANNTLDALKSRAPNQFVESSRYGLYGYKNPYDAMLYGKK